MLTMTKQDFILQDVEIFQRFAKARANFRHFDSYDLQGSRMTKNKAEPGWTDQIDES